MRERSMTAALAALLALSVMGFAQPQRRQTNADKQAGKNTANKERPRRTEEGDSITTKTVDHAVITGGEVRRTVKGDESIVLDLGMARSGATVVEFPASDPYFGVHKSDIVDWVRVEKWPTSRIDSHLVLRPGKDLEKGESTGIVQVQMRSGLTVTLCIHPVKSAAQHTNRAVIVYERDAIVEARRKAGLAVNLGEESRPQLGNVAAPARQPVVIEEKLSIPTPAGVISNAAPVGDQLQKEKGVDPKISESLKKALKDAMADPDSLFKLWSGPSHGLCVSAKMRGLDEGARVALVAVKNVENTPIQILPGHPEL